MTAWLRRANGVSSFLSSGWAENWCCRFCLACVFISPSLFLALNHSSCGTTNIIKNQIIPKDCFSRKGWTAKILYLRVNWLLNGAFLECGKLQERDLPKNIYQTVHQVPFILWVLERRKGSKQGSENQIMLVSCNLTSVRLDLWFLFLVFFQVTETFMVVKSLRSVL